jgi:hypothetical protein
MLITRIRDLERPYRVHDNLPSSPIWNPELGSQRWACDGALVSWKHCRVVLSHTSSGSVGATLQIDVKMKLIKCGIDIEV